MRWMGLDFGSKTVGVAVSDPLGLTAQPVEIVRRKSENKLRQTLARIEELIREYRVTELPNLWNLKKCWREGQACLLSCGTSALLR